MAWRGNEDAPWLSWPRPLPTVAALFSLLRGNSQRLALMLASFRRGRGLDLILGSLALEQIFAWAPAVIVAMGFRLFEQRSLLLSQLGRPPLTRHSTLLDRTALALYLPR